MPSQCGARVGASTGHHVEHPVGQACLGRQAGQRQGRQRCQLGWLDDHRASRSQRRNHLPHGHLQRVVPRCDRADHADCLPADRRGVVGGVLRGGLALEVPGRAGEERDVVDAARNVELSRQSHRLTGLADLLGHEISSVGTERLGEGEQHCRTLGRGGGRPTRQCGPRRGNRAVDVGGCGQGEFGDDCAGSRVDHLMATAVGDHWCAVDPATGSIRLGNHRPTVTEPGSYLYGFRGLAGQLTSFSIVHIGFGDEIRAQS